MHQIRVHLQFLGSLSIYRRVKAVELRGILFLRSSLTVFAYRVKHILRHLMQATPLLTTPCTTRTPSVQNEAPEEISAT
jgi:hypothetical protein